ncbi:hypothetical protein BDW71DRAFT_190595 [Aspergillus fruticulosus]
MRSLKSRPAHRSYETSTPSPNSTLSKWIAGEVSDDRSTLTSQCRLQPSRKRESSGLRRRLPTAPRAERIHTAHESSTAQTHHHVHGAVHAWTPIIDPAWLAGTAPRFSSLQLSSRVRVA